MAGDEYDTLIFDLDNTLYQSSSLVDTRTELTIDWIAESYNLSQESPHSFYQKLSDKFQHPYDGFTSIGLTIDDYFENVSYELVPSEFVETDESLNRMFSEVDSEIVVISLGPHSYVQEMVDAVGIGNHIDAIYNPYQDANSHSKGSIYERFSGQKVLVVGDSYPRDIEPAAELDFDTVHLDSECTISEAHRCIDQVEEVKRFIF
jgi:FMN phosphatase YigB (HAD superfamily)